MTAKIKWAMPIEDLPHSKRAITDVVIAFSIVNDIIIISRVIRIRQDDGVGILAQWVA